MEQGTLSRRKHMNDHRLLAIGLGLLAVISPLYIDRRRRNTEPDPDEESLITISSYFPLVILILIIMIMVIAISRGLNRFSSYRRLVAIGVAVVAVVSPLYIDREEPAVYYEEQSANIFSVLQPFVLVALIIGIAMFGYFDRSFTRFDPYWIHRVGGSSTGILILLLVLALVLKFKV